ncbi:MAG: histidine triad nucleotide-binding protein [Chloroflexi bacterium]|nr:histidine triad nucleotide-binding protein [Chloroflexota bacterium]MCY3937712.1 histidine triad nucleotide-binding protein [Chloroflexota bacterium]
MKCLFCDIAARILPSEIVFETDDVIAFRDINPAAPVHVLVIPKEHIDGIAVVDQTHTALLGRLMLAAVEVSKSEGVAGDGFRLVINQGREGGQTVGHLHIHLLGGRQMRWPSG